MVMAILTIVVIIAPLCGTVWRNLFVKPEFDVTLFENDTIVVCELDSYYHKQVQLLSQPDAPLGNHVVEIYLFNSTCNSVPTNTEAKSFEKSNISENQNFTNLYLLPKSSLNYTITPSTETNGSTKSVMGYVYITYGPELDLDEFNPRTCKTPNTDCTYEPFGNRERVEHSYPVTQRGYYNLHTVSIKPLNQYQYTLRLTVDASTVKLPQNNAATSVCIIQDKNGGDGSCTIDLDFKLGKVCLVAYTKAESNSPHPYIGLKAKVAELQLEMVSITTVVPSAIVVVIIIALMCLLTTCCCLKTRRNNDQYEVLRSIGT